MNTDNPSMKKERRESKSVTDLVAQIAGQQAHEQVRKLDEDLSGQIADLRRYITTLEQRINRMPVPGINPYTNLAEEAARQVCADYKKAIDADICELKNDFRNHRIKVIKDADVKRIKNSLQRHGFPWPEEEDKQLWTEAETALYSIAANHGRSAHAIRCRIQDKRILSNVRVD